MTRFYMQEVFRVLNICVTIAPYISVMPEYALMSRSMPEHG